MRYVHTISARLTLVLLLAFSVGCAGIQSAPYAAFASNTASEPPQPGTPFGDVEAAAVAALAYVRSTATRSETERLHVGSIVRIDGGFTWTEPQNSGTDHRSAWRPKVGVALTREHVATYVVHPRTGDNRTDRANEGFTRGEQRLVDEVDPLHRPMFLLTPSDRIVTYQHGATVVEVTDLRMRRRAKAASKADPSIVLADTER